MQDAHAAFIAQRFKKLLTKSNREMFQAHLLSVKGAVGLRYCPPKGTIGPHPGAVYLFFRSLNMPDFLRLRHFSLFFAVALLGALLLAAPAAHAQGKRKVIQFTGIVASGDSLLGVPGATIYVPKAGRGTSSNAYGYFSMAVLAGDSIIIRSLGYANYTIKIPADYQRQSYSVVVQLTEDATMLGEVRVFPYTTERDFKKAFLALRLPTERGSAAADNLNAELMQRIFRTQPMGAVANYRQTMQTQAYDYDRRQGMAPNQYSNNPLLNPFSWLKLVEQVKKGEFKKKDNDDY
ncbi:MAG: hypothetical protein JWR44_2067 [Hymenobacter sp.]|nr:hypothetical protein [Hymenobacter sp.]